MNSLAHTPPKESGGMNAIAIPTPEAADSGPEYPKLRLNGDQAEAAGLNGLTHGAEVEVRIRLKVTRVGGDSYEMKGSNLPPVEFDVISSDTPEEVESAADDNPDEEMSEEEAARPARKMRGKIQSPSDAGLEDDEEED
jgi:hypothetical protein